MQFHFKLYHTSVIVFIHNIGDVFFANVSQHSCILLITYLRNTLWRLVTCFINSYKHCWLENIEPWFAS